MDVLNPELYRAPKRAFRWVKVSNPGEVMNAIYQPDHEGTLRLQPLWPGEYYVVACPFCHDTTGHLYINHRWGVRDPRNGTRNLWLAHCFLSDCLSLTFALFPSVMPRGRGRRATVAGRGG